ncbi:NADH dehydrogenase [ubiquinone] 1 beta subcomplex subunit 10 [Dermacentor andersoni]|uniref:NADH dehydrogenase [ubiquinone] 1 beta subcomplex subunit 10 n=1 Tax=Dermacentor andersoni TaxID=34620 RepID=UPI002155748C|nr:NADH dehydrogenase [ubiquinone] 1 beta subcomplex subunit 10-like [Dermacentor andersoni]
MGFGDHPPRNGFEKTMHAFYAAFDVPVTWLREKIVEPNRADYNWYHRKYRRVPTIDECYTDDLMCKFEANEQFKRDREVDGKIVNLLSRRRDDCMSYELYDTQKCEPIIQQYKEAELNWFIKYGDLSYHTTVVNAFMKQKHRLIAERRRAQKAQEEAQME